MLHNTTPPAVDTPGVTPIERSSVVDGCCGIWMTRAPEAATISRNRSCSARAAESGAE
jgi:hypothetical protein